jgi:sigma-B regulation protein RsbU (phosphoserine phosphatase)
VSELDTPISTDMPDAILSDTRVSDPGLLSAGRRAAVPIAKLPWQERLAYMVGMMRDMSRQTDPQKMVDTYGEYIGNIQPFDRSVSLSRRGLDYPKVRVTRSTTWAGDVNPWRDRHKLPVIEGGLLAELIYKDEPTIIDEIKIDQSDPAFEYFNGMGSALALPLFDRGTALNMVISLRRQPNAYSREALPEYVWTSNLFGRATQNLVLSDEVKRAYDAVDRELNVVAEIQHDLLPQRLPDLKTLQFATHYLTSRWAGGDYYDVLPIDETRWGILIADVSGHGTPAAVYMALTHSLAHTAALKYSCCPAKFLKWVNESLSKRYTRDTGRFVTAFYGVYDDTARTLTYANAGHGPPRLRHTDGTITEIDGNRALPLGIDFEEEFPISTKQLSPGDTIVFYTDGVTETRDKHDDLFGTDRLDATIAAHDTDPGETVTAVLAAINSFRGEVEIADDVTLLVAKVS